MAGNDADRAEIDMEDFVNSTGLQVFERSAYLLGVAVGQALEPDALEGGVR